MRDAGIEGKWNCSATDDGNNEIQRGSIRLSTSTTPPAIRLTSRLTDV